MLNHLGRFAKPTVDHFLSGNQRHLGVFVVNQRHQLTDGIRTGRLGKLNNLLFGPGSTPWIAGLSLCEGHSRHLF